MLGRGTKMSRFDELYEGTPAWEIGRPQAAFVERAHLVEGRVLDVGCGTGENALFFAERGCEVIGVDSARSAIASAKRKAAARKLDNVDFLYHDALSVSALDRTFDVVIDSGFFHQLTDDGRRIYREEITNVLRVGGTLLVLGFSNHEPDWGGPRRLTQEEIRVAFAPPFFVESIEDARFETNRDEGDARAWMTKVTILGAARASEKRSMN